MWLLGPCSSGMGGLITLSLERGADAVWPEKQGRGCLCAWRGAEQTLKRMEWLQAGALGPQEAPPPPWQGRLRQYSTGRAAEALPDSHRLTNVKVSCFYCKWEAQGILKNQGMEF